MGKLMLPAVALALVAGDGAAIAQTVPPIVQPQHAPRWGEPVNGRWSGGARAPGGWNAYRRPKRGRTLPPYWVAPSFYVGDWAGYGLSQPPYGYNWSRYYDDAVLIDTHGRIYGVVAGVQWDRYDDGPPLRGEPLPPPVVTHSGDGTTTVSSSTAPGYYANGYYYPGKTVTTVTVQTAPRVDDAVTYAAKPAPKRKTRRRTP